MNDIYMDIIYMDIIYFFQALCIPHWEMFMNLRHIVYFTIFLSTPTHKKWKNQIIGWNITNLTIRLIPDQSQKISRIGSPFFGSPWQQQISTSGLN